MVNMRGTMLNVFNIDYIRGNKYLNINSSFSELNYIYKIKIIS